MTARAARAALLLFAAFVLIFASAVYLVFAAKALGLLVPAVVALAVGLGVLWFISGRETRPLIHIGAAAAALLFLAFVPRAIVLTVIARTGDAASGGAHCYYQAGNSVSSLMHAPSVLTRDVSDLSVSSMLGRRSRALGPPHVTLITPDWTWLWSFRERRFVQWQRIISGEGPPIIEGSQVEGRPPVAEVMRCLQMITNRGIA